MSEDRLVVNPVASVVVPKPKIAMLAWGSLIWKPQGDPAQGQKPLLIEGEWQQAELKLPLEYSRVSCDGRLTLVIDPTQKDLSKIHYAQSKFSELDEVVENLRQREGMPCSTNVHIAKKGEQYSDDARKAIGSWVDKTEFTAAVWTGLTPNFEKKRGQKFQPNEALKYLLGLKGEIRNKAFGYVISAPDSVDTSLRRIARWPEPIAIHEAGHYVMAILLGRKIVEVWIQRPDSDQVKSGCRYEEGDAQKRSLLELILSDLAGPRAQVCYHENSIQPWKLEKFKAAIVYPEAEHSIFSWTGWATTDLPRACGCYNDDLHPLSRDGKLVKGREAIQRIDAHLRDFISRKPIGRAVAMAADRLLELKHISGDAQAALETDVRSVLTEADYQEVYP